MKLKVLRSCCGFVAAALRRRRLADEAANPPSHSQTLFVHFLALLLTSSAARADVVSAAFTAGAAVTSNGSVISLGQPFVGRLQGAGVTLELGILSRVPPLPPVVPQRLQPQDVYVNGQVIGRIEFSDAQIQFSLSGSVPVDLAYRLEISGDLIHWDSLNSGDAIIPVPLEGQMFIRVLLLP